MKLNAGRVAGPAMRPISVVIVCKNEEQHILRCIASVSELTDDIVVLDSGSTDNTVKLVSTTKARITNGKWEGFGKTKNRATDLARHNWVLNLDADEALDDGLLGALQSVDLSDPNVVYELGFKNFLGKKELRFGEWGGDRHIRLFNKTVIRWTEAAVHEGLVLSPNVRIRRLNGFVLHFTVDNEAEFADKMLRYGKLSAERYAENGKRSSWLRPRIGAAFAFAKYYVFQLGFLDGHEGFVCAKMTAYYTFVKYARLLELNRAAAKAKNDSAVKSDHHQ